MSLSFNVKGVWSTYINLYSQSYSDLSLGLSETVRWIGLSEINKLILYPILVGGEPRSRCYGRPFREEYVVRRILIGSN